jgi:predicted dienelactone hydrolase
MKRALVTIAVAGCAPPVDPASVPRDPALDGPWHVGVTTISGVLDPVTRQTLTLEVWYPAETGPHDEFETTLGIPTSSVRDATPDLRGSPFPLVAFSHGSGGVRVQSVYLTQHLASWGYVVVAPDHPHDTLGSSSADRPEVLRSRPRQISLSVDAALAHDLIGAMIDGSRIGVAGHSFGAFTALALAGTKLDIDALRGSCMVDPDQLVCSGVDDRLTQAVADGFADPRFTAAVAIAPAGRAAFGAWGLAAVRAPVQVQGGSSDTLATPDREVGPIFDGLAGDKSFGMVDRAAHFSFTDICALYEQTGGAAGPLGFLATEGCGDLTISIDLAHAASRTLAGAFFDLHFGLADDEHGYLDPARGVANATVR